MPSKEQEDVAPSPQLRSFYAISGREDGITAENSPCFVATRIGAIIRLGRFSRIFPGSAAGFRGAIENRDGFPVGRGCKRGPFHGESSLSL